MPIVPAPDISQSIAEIESHMSEMPQAEIVTRHHFSPQGVYAREITIPAGVLLTGRVHKYAQLNILSKGDISVLTEDSIRRVQAPFTVVSPPGTKRIAYTHTECVWTTIHACTETDPDKIEALHTVATVEEYQAFCKAKEIKCLT